MTIKSRIVSKLILIFVLFTCSCDSAEERQVKKDFYKVHPNYTVTRMSPDGNATSILTYVIRYKKPSDSKEYWTEWAYETKDGRFYLVGKGNEKEW